MIKCPATFRIGALTYRLGLDPSDDDLPYGKSYSVSQEVTFSCPNMSAQRAFATLLHEYLHCYEASLSVEGSAARLDHDQIRWIGEAVTALLDQMGIDVALDISGLPVRRFDGDGQGSDPGLS